MRGILLVLMMASVNAFAFDSTGWLEKRSNFNQEIGKIRLKYASYRQKVVEPAENVTVPIDCYSDGSIKSSVFAKKAFFFIAQKHIWAESLTIHEVNKNGKPSTLINADNCLVDQVRKHGWIDGHAKAVYGDTELEGDGVFMAFQEEYLVIMNNARVLGLTNETMITSNRADYDKHAGVIMLEGDVRFKDVNYELNADRAFAFIEGTNDLKRVVVDGSVKVKSGVRTGKCASAMYVRNAGRVDLYGTVDDPAVLSEGGDRQGELSGDVIRYWIDSEQVEVKNSRIRVKNVGLEDIKR